jgi:hypothetical protein
MVTGSSKVREIELENEGVAGGCRSMISPRILLTFSITNRTIPSLSVNAYLLISPVYKTDFLCN